ncbi:TM2 domain-containing protein [Synechococcus sp. H55.9]|uniref:NINE protein n=1 Tax=Synechococcus sp. H55.9 TaxID=2964511 RepID=UPI0039C23491
MGSQDNIPPEGAEQSRSYSFNFTVSGSRQQVLRGLQALLELGLLTPEHFRHLVEQYRLEAESAPGATSVGGGIPASLGSAYVLWILGLFGLCGLHRFYLGRWRTGLLWLLTFGLLGIGQLLDLIWIPQMVRERNAGLAGSGVVVAGEEPPTETRELSSPPGIAVLLHNLLSELSVAWLLLLGLFLVVVSSGVLAASRWQEFSPAAQYGVLLAYTAAFGVGARWAQRQDGLRLTSQTLEAVALLLLPINMWALDGLGIPWGIRAVALGLLIGIPWGAWRRADLLGAGSAFYGTLVNFLSLSGLHLFWSLGPPESRPTLVLGILYLGILSTVIYTWSRRSLARLWLIGAAGSLLILRGLLSGQVQVSQLGLAVALLGWLPQSPAEDYEPAQVGRPWWSGVLLILGWLLAASDWGENAWQVLAISLLGIRFLARRLSQRQQRVELALLFLLGLETAWAFWQVWPASWRESVLALLTGGLQPLDSVWGLLGLVLLPYEVLWLGLAARWQQRPREGEEAGFAALAEPTERLVLGLGGSLLLLSFPQPAICFWHLLLSTGILAWWLRQKSRVGAGWVFLTHAYGLGALLAGIRWLWPDWSLSSWGAILLLLGLLEWTGRVALGGRLLAASGHFGGLPVRLWQQSAEGMGLVLLGSSYFVFLAQGTESIGWLWLAVPSVLTAAQVWAWPPLAFMPRWLQIPEQGGSFSWRQGIPARGSLRLLAVVSLVMAQGLTLGRPGLDLLGLGLGVLLLATQVWLWASPSPSSPAPEALLAVAFGVGIGLVGISRLLPTLTEAEWLLALAVLGLLLSGCRYGILRLSSRLQAAYRPALDGWGLLLGLVLLFALTVATTAALADPSRLPISVGKQPMFPGALPLAAGVALVALGLRLGVALSRGGSAVVGADGTDSATGSVSWAVVEGIAYGLIWALELGATGILLWVVQGSRPILPLWAVLNLGLGILFWIGPEKLLFPGGGELLQRVQTLSCWKTGPLIYAGLGWLGSHAQWSELTGVGSLGLAIVLLGLGQGIPGAQEQGGDSVPLMRTEEDPPVNWKGILGACGMSLAAYESWIHFLSQQTGGSWGDGLVLTALLGWLLAVVYRLCPPWLVATLQLKRAWLRWMASANWALANLVLWPALFDLRLSRWGRLLWVLTGSGLAAYAAAQGRRSTPGSPTEPGWLPTAWCHLSAWQGVGICLGSMWLGFPSLRVEQWAGSLLCGLGLLYYFLPWQRWGWPADPWSNTALVAPLLALVVTAGGDNNSNLLLGAAYYAFLAIWRSQVRLGYISLFLSNWILWNYGWQQDWASLTLYALPLVGSLLYVAQVDPGLQQAGARESRHRLRAFSSGLLVLVTLIETHGQLGAGFWPVGLGLALGVLGLALRVRAYLWAGTLGFGLGVLRQGWLWVTTDPILLWGMGILLGVLLIWAAANFEQRREQVGSRLSAWLEQLQGWE